LFINGAETVGGDTRVLLNTAQLLDSARYRSVCMTVPGPAREELHAMDGVEVHTAPLAPLSAGGGIAAGVADAAASLVGVVRLGRRVGADVIYAYDRTRAAEIAYAAARLLRKPLLFHTHYPFHLRHRSVRRWTAFHADRIVAISRFVAEAYEEAGCPTAKLRVVLNGVDRARSHTATPGALRRQLGIPADSPVVGMVGRLSPFKGTEDLVRAAAIMATSLPGLRVIIAGPDTDESRYTHGPHETSQLTILERLRGELGLEGCVKLLEFSGFIPAVPAEVYDASDVVAVPSHEEPFGLVILEAMLAGRAVVSCNSGAPPEIITDGETGVLVPPRSPDALAAALVDLLRDDTRRARIAAAGRRHAAEHFSLERYGRDFEQVLLELL
jgi:glycosyltransferase involved in cell wall biosynthesis